MKTQQSAPFESAFQFWAESDENRGLVLVDIGGSIVFWNSACERITGYTCAEARGARWSDLFPFELGPLEGPVTLKNRNGDVLFLRTQIRPVDGGGWALCIQPLHDAASLESLHQATRDALAVSQERFQSALQGANDGIWDWNLVTNSVFYSPRWKTMLGYDPEELPGTLDTWRRLVHPDDLPLAEQKVSQYLAGEIERYEVEFRMFHKLGGVRNILARARVVLDHHGHQARLVGTHVDITERKQAEEALRRSEQLLQRAQSLANLAGWTYKIQSQLLTTSSLGEYLLDRPDLRHVHPDDAARLQAAWEAALQGRDLELEYRLVHAEVETWVFVRATVERDAAGELFRIIGVVQNITEQKKLQEQFYRAQKMEAVGQLAGGLAHDYNNIITIITASTEFILGEYPDSPYREDLLAILQASDRAASLTRQLLAYSGKQLLKPQPLNLNEVVQHLRVMLARVIREDITFHTDPQFDLSMIRADVGQIEQVLLNLVINARDAMDKGGMLTIATRNLKLDGSDEYDCPPGDYVEMVVKDTGTGMSSEVMSKLFQPFFTTKEVGRGTGLGLATVHGIVHQSGGYLRVTSAEGVGSSFSAIFPAISEIGPDSSRSSGPNRGEKGEGTILLVEDEVGVRRIARKLLEANGYLVFEAGSALEALELVEKCDQPIDLLLTDVIMPGQMNGADLACRLRLTMPELRVLFISGYVGEALIRNGISVEDDSLLPKPFTPTLLFERIQKLLKRPAALR